MLWYPTFFGQSAKKINDILYLFAIAFLTWIGYN